MRKLPCVSGETVIRTLKRLGFVQIRQQGSHVILKRESKDGVVGCVVPMHKELAIGTLHGILKQAKVQPEEFLDKL